MRSQPSHRPLAAHSFPRTAVAALAAFAAVIAAVAAVAVTGTVVTIAATVAVMDGVRRLRTLGDGTTPVQPPTHAE